MPFYRKSQREANGKHLWEIMRAEMMDGRPPVVHEPTWSRLPEEVQRAYIVGAEAMRQMPR